MLQCIGTEKSKNNSKSPEPGAINDKTKSQPSLKLSDFSIEPFRYGFLSAERIVSPNYKWVATKAYVVSLKCSLRKRRFGDKRLLRFAWLTVETSI